MKYSKPPIYVNDITDSGSRSERATPESVSPRSAEQGRNGLIVRSVPVKNSAMNPKMRSAVLALCLVLVVGFFSTGCSTVSVTSEVSPNADLTSLKSFYVVKVPNDDEGIDQMITSELTGMGYQAESGLDAKPPTEVDAILKYNDRWAWDMTMYMIELTVDIVDPVNHVPLANGRSFRTSLARKKPLEMVKEVLTEVFHPGSFKD